LTINRKPYTVNRFQLLKLSLKLDSAPTSGYHYHYHYH